MASDYKIPTVDGLTETMPDTEPEMVRLTDLLAHRTINVQDEINRSLDGLARAFAATDNERLKALLATAITVIREGPSSSKPYPNGKGD